MKKVPSASALSGISPIHTHFSSLPSSWQCIGVKLTSLPRISSFLCPVRATQCMVVVLCRRQPLYTVPPAEQTRRCLSPGLFIANTEAVVITEKEQSGGTPCGAEHQAPRFARSVRHVVADTLSNRVSRTNLQRARSTVSNRAGVRK